MSRFLALLLLLAACDGTEADDPAPVPAAPATYEVIFAATWSAETHPEGFPANPHFSRLVGAVHDADVVLWEPDTLASPGVESMAETGARDLLLEEVEAAGTLAAPLTGGNIRTSPGSVTLTFEATSAHPRVTLVSMLASSPDWFVGTRGLALHDDALRLRGWPDARPTAQVVISCER